MSTMRPDAIELIDALTVMEAAFIKNGKTTCAQTCRRAATMIQAVFDQENQPSQFNTVLLDPATGKPVTTG